MALYTEQKPDNNFSQPRKIFQFSIQPKDWIDALDDLERGRH